MKISKITIFEKEVSKIFYSELEGRSEPMVLRKSIGLLLLSYKNFYFQSNSKFRKSKKLKVQREGVVF